MNAVVRALFDDAAITGAQAAGLKDTSTAAMRAAVREWFELFFMEIHKEGGLAYMEELRAQFPGEDIDALIKQYTDPRPYSVIQKEILEEFEKTLKKPL